MNYSVLQGQLIASMTFLLPKFLGNAESILFALSLEAVKPFGAIGLNI
jgi:hypothetical protein